MNLQTDLDALCMRLVLAFVHFLWQGALFAALTLGFSCVLRRARALYALHAAALLLMALCPILTFAFLMPAPTPPANARPLLPRDAADAHPAAVLVAAPVRAIPLESHNVGGLVEPADSA